MRMSEYVGNLTEAYTADPEKFERESRAAHKDLWSLYDLNMDCLLEEDEVMRLAASSVGHNNTIAWIEYFVHFRQPSGILLGDMVDSWVRFRTNVNRIHNETDSALIEKVAQ